MKNIQAYISEMTEHLKKHHILVLLFLILCLGVFFRLADFSELARFNADQVRDAKIVDAMFEGTFPELGPKAGGTTFKLGPGFYYFEYISGLLFGHDPAGIALFIPLLSLAAIGLFFLFFRSYFPPHLTLALTFLYAVSFYAARYAHFAWNPNAVPFFLLAFLLLLQQVLKHDDAHIFRTYTLLGIVIGIGAQLHTTLLLVMPLLFVLVHLYLYFQRKTFSLRPFLLAVGLILLLHTPFIIHDVSKNGKNILAFFEGTEKKSEKNISIVENILLDTQFFVQGNTYALTGLEPQKSWIKISKLLASKNLTEIALFVFGILLFAGGLLLSIFRLKRERDQTKKHFLLIILALGSLLFLLFLPIAEELNIRFFIVIFFLPFLFLGLIAEYFLQKFRQHPRFSILLVSILFGLLAAPNISTYFKAYDLDNYTERESLYGGISLGEAERIAQSIHATSQTSPDKKLFFAPFEFARSIEYLVERKGSSLSSLSRREVTQNSLVFSVTEKEKTKEAREKYACCYTLLKEETFGRFTLLSFLPKDE